MVDARKLLLLISIWSCICSADPVLMDSEIDFHKLDINTTDPVKRASCRQCHMVEFTTKDGTLPLWLRGQENKQFNIKDLEETPEEPDPFSLACLSCHDGSMASVVLNAPVSPCGIKPAGGVSDPGSNHPVFVRYSARRNDLYPEHRELPGNWEDATDIGDLLRDDKVVCISCHIPHHSDKSSYLRTTQRGSALCLGCHKK